jgi:hypothetical protein
MVSRIKAKEMYLGIVGSRDRISKEDRELVENAYESVINNSNYEFVDWIIISGGQPIGADGWAYQLAKTYGHDMYTAFPKTYNAETQEELRQSYLTRNTKIAEKSHILIACPSHSRRSGTHNTITKFKLRHPDRELILV